jgi:hypothetical protein
MDGRGKREENSNKLSFEKPKIATQLEKFGLNGRIIFKCISVG